MDAPGPDEPSGLEARVIKPYAAQYPNPIEGLAGQQVEVGREDDENPGWKWCKGPDGREGWVPLEILSSAGDTATLLEDYSAAELDVAAGDELKIEVTRHGWVLVRNSRGKRGWVPASHIETLTPNERAT
jgi:SH3-like domain-containing protein